MIGLVKYLQTLLKFDIKYKLLMRLPICHFCREHGVVQQAYSTLLSMCKPSELICPWTEAGSVQEQLNTYFLISLESTVSFSLRSLQTRFRLVILTPIPWPTWHFVLICKPVKQKWERRLNKCSVLKCLWVGKAFWRDNNNQILSIFISLISLPLGWRASQFLCCCPGFLFTAKGIYIHVRVSRSISCYTAF